MTETNKIDVQDNPSADRYEVSVDGAPAGVLTYRLGSDRITFTHAVVDPAFGGRGVGSALAAYALDDARARDLQVLPECAFMADYVSKHAEYAELVPADQRDRYGLGSTG